MSFRRLWAVARKETIHVLRDPRALGIGIAMPVLLLLLFGYALTLDVDHVPLAVWDQSGTPESRDLVAAFSGSPYFDVAATVSSYARIEGLLDSGRILAALVIPRDYVPRLSSPRGAAVQIIADGSDANTATIALGYARSIVQARGQTIIVASAHAAGRPAPKPPLDLRPRVWFNADMVSRNFIVPGLIAVIMMIIAALLTSLTVAREWETGTMEQLISTPLRGPELILGKLLPYFAIGMLDMALSVLLGRYAFGVPLRGSVFLLVTSSAVFLVGALSLGLFISASAKSQLLASQMAFVITFLPAFLLSGFMYDIGNMPRALQFVSYAIPARYFIALLRGLYLKGTGLRDMAAEALFLLLFAAVMALLAMVRFKKKVA